MPPRVAVIGAGASGLKVAADLLEADVSVTIIESTGRAGGRVRSSEIGGQVVDLGAESFEAGEDSEWIKQLTAANVIPKGTEWKDPFDGVDADVFWYVDGALTKTTADDVLFSPSAQAVERCFQQNIESALDIPVASGVKLDTPEARLAYAVSGCGAFSESIEPSMYSAQDRARNESAGADVRPYLHDEPLGVGNLFERYAEKLRTTDGCRLRLGATLHRIAPRVEGGFRLRVDDDDLDFDAVVITVSTAVLAAGGVPLPESFQRQLTQALRGIELGGYLKVALHWPSAAAALSAETYRAYYVGTPGMPAWQIDKLAGSEVVVVALAGNLALDLPRDDVFSQAESVVRIITRVKDDPASSVTADWKHTASFRGAYSFSRAGAGAARPQLQLGVIEALAPFGLFFAGEAFSVPFYGSVEATWYTGAAAAARCLKYLGL